jgi:acyl carrier protein
MTFESENDLLKMIVSITDCTPEQIQLSMPLKDIPGWDSLASVIFVSELESVCGFTLLPSDIKSLDTVDSVVKLLQVKRGAS